MKLYGKLQVDRFPTIFFLPEIYISAVYIYVGVYVGKIKNFGCMLNRHVMVCVYISGRIAWLVFI